MGKKPRAPARQASIADHLPGWQDAELGADLDRLEAYLVSDRAPPDSMLLSDLDGFLTGLLAGPDPVPTEEWMPVLWGDAQPAFASEAEREAVIGAIARRYATIERELADGDVQPIWLVADDGTPSASVWAAGFVTAMQMRAEAWAPLAESARHAPLLLPFIVLTTDEATLEEEDIGVPLEDDYDALAQMIPSCVVDIAAFWRRRRRRAR